MNLTEGGRRQRRINPLETVFALLVSVLVIHVVSGQDVCRDPSSDDERAAVLNQPVCYICPRGTSNIEWFFDGAPVSTTDGLTAYSNGSLFIDSVLQKFIGPTFLCRDTNTNQRTLFSLSIASISIPTVSNATVNETDNLSIRCRPNANPFPNTQVWLRNGQVVSTNSLLEIPNIQRAQAGLYTCNTTNTVGSAESTITVTVQYAPSNDLTVTSPVPWMSNTSLMCSFDAVPTPTITWKVNGTEIVSGNDNYIIRTLDTTSFLDIIGTELETSGDYMCGATNLLGTSSDQEELIVQVPPDPPSGFSSQDVTTDGFHLRWMTQFDGNSAITSALVMYTVSGSSDPPANTTANTVTSHTLSGLMANTRYTVTVFLINDIGASSGGVHEVTTLSLQMFVRFANTTQYTVDEDVGSFDVYFEVVREVSPGVYVPAECTFDFQVLVKTVNGTATGDSDFEGKEESVTFSAGDQFSAPFTVKITEDTVAECTEQFTITRSIISTSVKEGAMIELLGDNATVIISDNDESKISFSFGDMTASEGDSLELRLVADNVFEIEQFIHLSGEDGPSGDEDDNCVDETDDDSDYLLSSDSEDGEDVEDEDGEDGEEGENDENTPVIVRFPPNSRMSDPFQVDILDDMEVENYEKFFLYFSIPEAASSCGARYGEIRSQDILIKDDDGVRIGFEVTSVIRTEGSTVSLKVYRQGCITRAVKVSVGPELITASAKDFKMKKSIAFGNVRRCSGKKTFKIKLRKDKDMRDKFLENFTVVMKKANRRGIGFDQRCVNVDILDPTRPTLHPVPRPSIPPITPAPVPSNPPSMPPIRPTGPPGRG